MRRIQETLEVPQSPTDSKRILAQVERVNASPLFLNSPLLQSFLRTIAEKTVAERESEINEYFIATEVFSRTPDFDPSTDTIVRTQAYRLRLKLQEYYRTLGQKDDIVIEVPKGHYIPSFRQREQSQEDAHVVLETPDMAAILSGVKPGTSMIYVLFAITGILLFFVGRWSAPSSNSSVPASQEKPLSSAEQSFWETFLAGDRQPLVAYTNTQFLATAEGDMLHFSGGPVGDRGTMVRQQPDGEKNVRSNAPMYFIDDMTGVGEVAGSVSLVNSLDRLGVHAIFKRSRLVTTYDLQSHNVIFLGAFGQPHFE